MVATRYELYILEVININYIQNIYFKQAIKF